ncbi:MAG TPA: glycosyltransferase family 1 protein [Alphaproteobacteria bacterium]|nr:glycosyltransferase family 1 protein [Alphaproteobacteria bacterium]
MQNSSLRVAWDNSLTRRNPTGSGVYSTQMIQELRRQPDVALEVFNGWDPGKRKLGDFGRQGVVARAARAVRGLAWSYGYFPLQLRRGKFDILHSPSFVVPFGCPCRTVATIFDVSFLMFPEHFEQRWRNYMKYVMPSVLRSVSAVICISECARHDLLRFYKVAPEKVHVVYCGIDHARYNQKAALNQEWARKIGLRKDYILHVGLLSQRKNIPTLLRAVASLRAQGRFENLQLVLAGPELSVLTGADEIYDTIQQRGLSDVVVLAGFVPDEHMPGLYAHARLLAMPSIYEGFGLPVAESMASGVPVVASDTSSLPEIAAGAAILVPPHDEAAWAEGITKVLENPATAEDMRRKGLERAAIFSWQRAAEETAAIYRTVAGS